MPRAFAQVDVFANEPYAGNPVAVVLDGAGLSTDAMQRLAHWTNLSETTFVAADRATRPPTIACASSRPAAELPFAGHPTLGTCHAWLEAGGVPRAEDTIVQECGAGLVPIRRTDAGLAFAAPPLAALGPGGGGRRGAPGADARRRPRRDDVDTQWVDNGPGWVAVLLDDAEAVLALAPGLRSSSTSASSAPYPPGSAEAFEVRAFIYKDGAHGRGPGHRQPQRVAGAVAARHGPGHRAVRGAPGHRARPRRAAST